MSASAVSPEKSALTAREVVRLIESHIPPLTRPDTVDTFKCGNEDAVVRGIATTFMATWPVLGRAIRAGANLLITHEPTFYNHRDETQWLEGDPVCRAKRKFLEEQELIVWRFHDGWHRIRPDGILAGEERDLGWEQWKVEGEERVYRLPEQSVKSVAEHCKKCFGIDRVRVAGDPEMKCQVAGLLPGAVGGRAQIGLLMRPDVELVVCGESPEWETCEYVRDAVAMGQKKALIVLGHANSEEAGMAYFAEWLRARLPGSLPVTHLVAGDPFHFL